MNVTGFLKFVEGKVKRKVIKRDAGKLKKIGHVLEIG